MMESMSRFIFRYAGPEALLPGRRAALRDALSVLPGKIIDESSRMLLVDLPDGIDTRHEAFAEWNLTEERVLGVPRPAGPGQAD